MSLGLAGRWLPVASSHCFVLQSWLARCFLPFIYCRRDLGLGSEAAWSYGGPFGREGLWLSTEAPSRNPGLVSWGLHPSFHVLPCGTSFCMWASGWGVHTYRQLSLAGGIKIILNPLFSLKCHVGWEAAIPGHLAVIPSLNLLEQSLSLFGHALSKLL